MASADVVVVDTLVVEEVRNATNAARLDTLLATALKVAPVDMVEDIRVEAMAADTGVAAAVVLEVRPATRAAVTDICRAIVPRARSATTVSVLHHNL